MPAGALASTIGLVKGCVPTRSTIPILNHVHVSASSGEVCVRGTNLDMDAVARCEADVAQDGAVALPGEILAGIVKRMPKSQMVTVSHDGEGRAEVVCGAARYALRVLPADDFPKPRGTAEGATFDMPCAVLRGMIETTRYALSSGDDTRLFTLGAYLHVKDDRLAIVSNDGHRLARQSCALPAGAADMPGAIIPGMAMREIHGMLDDGDVRVTVTDAEIRVEVARLRFASVLIDTSYPPYERVIPDLSGPHITIKPRALSDALERAAVLYTGTDVKAPSIGLQASNGAVEMDAGLAQFDTGKEAVDAAVHDLTASFRLNVKYFAEMLKLWPSDIDLDIQVTDGNGPVVFTASEMPDVLHLIMPQRK
ncbi:MAG: DNA polymerase III subunit beta [Pseudomonadota bacterium]